MNPVCAWTWRQLVAPPVLFAICSHVPSRGIPGTGRCCHFLRGSPDTRMRFHRGHRLPCGWGQCCCSPNRGGPWTNLLAAVPSEGIQFILPVWGAGMSLEQERPVLPNSPPTGCQMTSVIAWVVTALKPFRATPSHCFSNLGSGRVCSNPLLGDLFLSLRLHVGNHQLASPQSAGAAHPWFAAPTGPC